MKTEEEKPEEEKEPTTPPELKPEPAKPEPPKKPEPKKPPYPVFKDGETVSVRLSPRLAKALNKLSRSKKDMNRQELLAFCITYTRKNHLW